MLLLLLLLLPLLLLPPLLLLLLLLSCCCCCCCHGRNRGWRQLDEGARALVSWIPVAMQVRMDQGRSCAFMIPTLIMINHQSSSHDL